MADQSPPAPSPQSSSQPNREHRQTRLSREQGCSRQRNHKRTFAEPEGMFRSCPKTDLAGMAASGAKRSFDEAGGLLYLLDRLRGLTTIERC